MKYANTNAFNALSLREALDVFDVKGDEAISKNGLLRFARNDNYCVCINKAAIKLEINHPVKGDIPKKTPILKAIAKL